MTELVAATPEQKETLRNLLEKYLCEFAQWDHREVAEDGLYHYPWLDCYWTEPGRFAYLIRVDGHLAGFALVNDYPEIPDRQTDFGLAEFLSCPDTAAGASAGKPPFRFLICTMAGGNCSAIRTIWRRCTSGTGWWTSTRTAGLSRSTDTRIRR
ncbi:MAG: hypothetical protein PUD63_08180 [Clostridia bacterium]|nr:hypothetical protein [Clostridia bacterium]